MSIQTGPPPSLFLALLAFIAGSVMGISCKVQQILTILEKR